MSIACRRLLFIDKNPFYLSAANKMPAINWMTKLTKDEEKFPFAIAIFKTLHEKLTWGFFVELAISKKISVDSLETNWTSHERLEMEICMTTVYRDVLKFTKLWASGFFQAPSLANWHKLPL